MHQGICETLHQPPFSGTDEELELSLSLASLGAVVGGDRRGLPPAEEGEKKGRRPRGHHGKQHPVAFLHPPILGEPIRSAKFFAIFLRYCVSVGGGRGAGLASPERNVVLLVFPGGFRKLSLGVGIKEGVVNVRRAVEGRRSSSGEPSQRGPGRGRRTSPAVPGEDLQPGDVDPEERERRRGSGGMKRFRSRSSCPYSPMKGCTPPRWTTGARRSNGMRSTRNSGG